MTTAIDVAKYIKSRMSILGEVQLQKLVYYSQAWSLAWDGQRLFDDRVEAWRMGPVVPNLRRRSIDADADAEAVTDARERSVIDAVVEHYGSQHGQSLARLSHEELPWKATWGDRDPKESGHDEIKPHLMRTFYAQQSIQGGGPRRIAAQPGVAADGVVADRSKALAGDWAHTLHLLSQ